MAIDLDSDLCISRVHAFTADGMKLRECAYELLHELILSHQLKSGTPLVERELEALFGISRTPLRQAIEKLEGQGLVSRVSERMACVKVVNLEEYIQALSMRLILEVEATKLCIKRIPRDAFIVVTQFIEASNALDNDTQKHWCLDSLVHALISDNCGNQLMKETIERMRIICNLYEEPRTTYSSLPGWQEHIDIFNALMNRDEILATQLMGQHLTSIKQRLLGDL